MEDILAVYSRPFDEDVPLVCLDESSRQLMDSVREAERCAPGRPARHDSEFIAGRKLSLFMIFAPILGWRRVKVSERRCATDFAEVIRELLEQDFPKAKKIVLVMDNLNTHSLCSLYKKFEPSHARRLAERLEIHYTPKHGSWLNTAEIELSVLARQCLRRRIPTRETMERESQAWSMQRNQAKAAVSWRFTSEEARIKLKRLYPTIEI